MLIQSPVDIGEVGVKVVQGIVNVGDVIQIGGPHPQGPLDILDDCERSFPVPGPGGYETLHPGRPAVRGFELLRFRKVCPRLLNIPLGHVILCHDPVRPRWGQLGSLLPMPECLVLLPHVEVVAPHPLNITGSARVKVVARLGGSEPFVPVPLEKSQV